MTEIVRGQLWLPADREYGYALIAAEILSTYHQRSVERVYLADFEGPTGSGKHQVVELFTHLGYRVQRPILSKRAGLSRPVGAHALRHYAATALLRRTENLELVRQILRHETLAMTLRYAQLTRAEVAARFAAASPMDQLRDAVPQARARTQMVVGFGGGAGRSGIRLARAGRSPI